MPKLIVHAFVFVAVSMLTTSCLHAGTVDEEEMLGLAAALTKVSAPVHSTVRYKNPPTNIHDEALLGLATAHNPKLLNAFDGYVLKARQDGLYSSVLVCAGHGNTALIEDAGCTGGFDLQIWKTNPQHSCDYVLDLAQTCSGN